MLVLTRAIDEGIVIGEGPDAVTVIVVDIRGTKVRLGIVANDSIKVDRCEIRDGEDYNPNYRAKGGGR